MSVFGKNGHQKQKMPKQNNFKDILKKYNIAPKKSLGQNFLYDENALMQIAQSTHIEWENIIEVGPWFWALTYHILPFYPQSLTLIELDTKMIDVLNARIDAQEIPISLTPKFELLHQDILQYTPPFWEYKVIANIPYYITSPILQHFLYQVPTPPKEMIILMQEEVGEKILSNKSSVLSLYIAKKCIARKIQLVSRYAFIPAPKVDSIVLWFQPHDKYDHISDRDFLAFLYAAFKTPRKKLINNLIGYNKYTKTRLETIFISLNFPLNIRWDSLSIEKIITLFLSL